MPKDDLLERALNFATRAHAWQTRKDGETPYITHPVAVSALVAFYGGGTVAQAVALLHDTIEDCDVTYEELKEEFGADVAVAVRELSNVAEDTSVYNKHVQEDKYMRAFKGKSPEACLVKLCDRIHNIGDWKGMSPDSRISYMASTFKLYEGIMLNKRIVKSPLYNNICNAANNLLKQMWTIKGDRQ